jgi:hypothetical protein
LPDINGVTNYDAWRSLAVAMPGSYGATPHESYLIQTTRQGGLLAWKDRSRSLGVLATEYWAEALQEPVSGGYTLSPPLVCNAIPDLGPYSEIIVTNTAVGNDEDPTIWIYDDIGNGTSISDSDWVFYNSGSADPPPRPVAVDEDEVGDHTVVVAGGGQGQVNTYAYSLNMFGSVVVEEMVDSHPLPSRGYTGGGEGWTEPLVVQVDDQDGFDVLAPTRMKSVVGWDLDSGEAKQGWPLLLGEQPLTPAVSGDRMYIAAGEVLYAWNLPSSNSGVGWSQYAGGPQRYGMSGEFWGDNQARVPAQAYWRAAPQAGSMSLSAIQGQGSEEIRIEYSVRAGREFALDAFDVGGRRVARLAHGVGSDDVEVQQTTWSPRVPSGVFFIRLDDGIGTASRRVVVVR